MERARFLAVCTLVAALAFTGLSCASIPSAASAEEYYNLGIAYYDLGKFAEAEGWFLKAKRADKTRGASEYNLGRIAFETGRTEEAIRIFETLLKKDPDNVLTLKAAAFARLKNGDLEKAEAYYLRVVELLPETVDSTYNYALVLHASKKDERALEVLFPLLKKSPDDLDMLLLLARVEKTLGRPEAVDRYARRLELGDDPRIRREYAEACEAAGLYARAVENYDLVLSSDKAEKAGVVKNAVRFAKARALLIAGGDSTGDGGLTELKAALAEGFKDDAALDALAADERISSREEVAAIIAEGRATAAEKAAQKKKAEDEKNSKKTDSTGVEDSGLAQKDLSGK